MKYVSEDYKLLSKNLRQQDIKLSILGGNELTVKEIDIMPVNIFNAIPLKRLKEKKQVIAKEVVYSFEGQLFKTIMKQIDITVKNANEIKGKNVNFKYGLFVNNEYEYVDLGSYFIKDIEDDKKKDSLTVTGYDKMICFMKTFKQSELKLTYPCKISQLVQRMGEVCGVEIYSLDFYNADLLVDDDFFTIQELTYRDVLEKITQATLTTAFIKDDKLYFCKIENTAVQKLDKSYISNLIVMEKFGPLNALVIGRGEVEDNLESTDDKSILENGRCEIRFDENELIQYSNRKDVIDNMLEEIKGLEYYSFEGSDLGVMWLEPCDVIELGDRENNFYKSIYLNAHIVINTGIESNISADLPEETNTEYKVTTKEEKKHLKVERLAKKNEGLIQDLIEETSEHEKKITEVIQDADSITQTIKNTIDILRESEGIKTLKLENCMPGELEELHIFGNNTAFKENSVILVKSENLKNDYSYCFLGSNGTFYEDENQHSASIILKADYKKFVIKKKAGAIFRVSTFNEYPQNELEAIQNIKDDTSTDISISIDNEKYLVVNFWNSELDEETLETLFNSIEIYSNYQVIDLKIQELPRQKEEIRDEYCLEKNQSKIIRRIGVHENGETYVLPKEIIEDIEELHIELTKGTNYIEIQNYTANMTAKYAILNDFTDKLASKVELKTEVKQSSDSIKSTLTKKLDKEKIIAAINMAVLKLKGEDVSEEEVEKTVIQLIANILEIDTDNFKLERDGTTTIKKGIIAGLSLWRDYYNNIGRSWLTKDFTENSNTYRSGLLIRDSEGYNSDFIFAGMPVNGESWNTANANLRVSHNGHVQAKWFRVNGENGYFYIDFDSGRRALDLYSRGIAWYLDDDTNNKWFSIYRNGNGQWFDLRDAPFMGIWDSLHSKNIATFYRLDPNSEYRAKNTAVIDSYADIIAQGTREDGVNHSFFINTGGKLYEVATNAVSDKRLKKRIKKSTESALEIIKKIKICKFEWKKPRNHKRKAVDFGYIAQQVQQVLKSLVIHDNKEDTYQMDVLGLSALHTKAIQEIYEDNQNLHQENKELKKQVKLQQKQIEYLANKLNCIDEINYLEEGGRDV